MSKVLVVFASKSNKPVYDRVVSYLRKQNADFELRICSAHKTPDALANILKNKYDVIIAGAGMAAHLAGVIASKTVTPVIGVPCSDNFNGLDALLSTLQMPPGIPVMSVGVDCAEESAASAVKVLKPYNRVSILVKNPFAEKTAELLKRLDVPYELSYVLCEDAVNIRFVDINSISEVEWADDKLVINCPITSKNSAADSLKLLEIKKGLWVSLNRADNAALAAAQVFRKEEELLKYRKEIAAAVIKADQDERNTQ